MHVPTQKRMFLRWAFFDLGQLSIQHPVYNAIVAPKILTTLGFTTRLKLTEDALMYYIAGCSQEN